MSQAREWGPNEDGRWGNNMMYLRDDTAERLIIANRRIKRLRANVESGQYTRLHLLNELSRLSEENTRCLLNLVKAGAPVLIESLDI